MDDSKDLIKLKKDIQKEIKEERRKQRDEEMVSMMDSVNLSMREKVLNPFLNDLSTTLVSTFEGIKQSISHMKMDVKVPEIKFPEIKLPEIKIPKPEINMPEIKIPPVNVPQPKVTVNIPKTEFPEIKVPKGDVVMPNNMDVRMKDIDRKHPLPVSMMGVDGKPLSFPGGGAGVSSKLLQEISDNGETGFVSVNNSSTATLTGDEVFTGTGDDVSSFASVSILYKSDVAAAASGLSIQFSQDNTNWDVQLVGDLGAKTFQVHALKPAAKFFRVVYTNGSAAQSLFRLQCIFHKSASPVLITRAGQPQSTVDATPTRLTTDIDLDFARKHIPGGRAFFFFGHNDAVGTSFEDIHPSGGDINWLTTATKVEVVSTNAADTSAGLGTRQVEIHGLSTTGEDQDEVITMNGTTPVESALTYIRINKMHNENVGTYGGSHQGDVTCQVTGAGAVLTVMTGEEGAADSGVQYGSGEANNGYWSVPLGKVLYITDLTVNVSISGNKNADVILYEREGILNTSAPFDPRRILWNVSGLQGVHREVFKSHIKIKNLTDLFFRAKGSGAVAISSKLHFYLVDADADGA